MRETCYRRASVAASSFAVASYSTRIAIRRRERLRATTRRRGATRSALITRFGTSPSIVRARVRRRRRRRTRRTLGVARFRRLRDRLHRRTHLSTAARTPPRLRGCRKRPRRRPTSPSLRRRTTPFLLRPLRIGVVAVRGGHARRLSRTFPSESPDATNDPPHSGAYVSSRTDGVKMKSATAASRSRVSIANPRLPVLTKRIVAPFTARGPSPINSVLTPSERVFERPRGDARDVELHRADGDVAPYAVRAARAPPRGVRGNDTRPRRRARPSGISSGWRSARRAEETVRVRRRTRANRRVRVDPAASDGERARARTPPAPRARRRLERVQTRVQHPRPNPSMLEAPPPTSGTRPAAARRVARRAPPRPPRDPAARRP